MNTELDQLLDALRDGALDDAGGRRLCALLAGDAGAKAALRRRLALEGHLIDALAVRRQAPTIPRLRAGRRRQRRPALVWPVLLALAAVLVVGIGLLWHGRAETLAEHGISAASGIAATEIRPGRPLSGNLAWTHADGTRIVLDGSLTWRDGGGLHYRLNQGSIVVAAAHQTDDALTISTAHGEARVVGTRFRLSTSSAGSRLAVEAGTVVFTDRQGQRRDVGAGGDVATDSEGRLPPATSVAKHAVPGLQSLWSADLSALDAASRQAWFGRPVPDGLAPVLDPKVSAESNGPVWRVAPPERMSGDAFGPVSQDLAMEVDLSLAHPQWVLVVLGTWAPDAAQVWRANIQGGGERPAGRQRLTLHWSDLHKPDGTSAAPALGASIRQISVVCGGQHESGMTVHSITLAQVGSTKP